MKKKFLSCVVALAASLGLMTCTVFAEDNANMASGLSVTIETDKESYNNGDVIDLDVTIQNNSSYTLNNLSYEIVLPEGVTVAEGVSLSGNLYLPGNYSRAIDVTSNELSGFTAAPGNTGTGNTTTPNTGDNSAVSLLIVLAAGAAAVLVAVKCKKHRKDVTALVLVVALGVSSISVIPANAAPSLDSLPMTTVKTISVEGVAKDITVIIKATSENGAEAIVNTTNIGIHDPSVFYDPVSGEYYSYGSHIIAGNSDDLVSWTYTAGSSVGYGTTNKLFSKHYLEEFADIYAWLGSNVKEGIWALDVTYSEAAAKAGNDPYFMYVTVTNATRDALVLATAAKPEGPFKYKEAIVFSDFRESEVESGPVNLLDVLGVDSLDDLTAEQKEYYITADTTEYRSKFPQCIDAAPYYDGDGNMYLAYGSFSSTGALHVLKLDPETGLRADDNYKYNPAEKEDPYYGRQIATKRGEGPYVLTVKSDLSSTGYYYFLFWSQGTLSSTGGYNMRMLRSEYPDRGFVDYSGKSAMDSSVVGVRIMDNFWFTGMQYSSTANGGNSAIVTNDGKMFLHYHSKSAHTAAYGENGFIIKSNQMFLNEDGWLVTTPYKYNGETMSALSKDDVVGDYEFVYHTLASYRHPADFNMNFVSSEYIRLNADGTVSGKHTGTWSMKDNYFTINVDGKEYKGVVLEQYDESANRVKTVVFTAEGTDNRTVWGSKIYYDDATRVSVDVNNVTITDYAEADFTLPVAGRLNSTITWSSNNAAIVINGSTADVVRQDYDQNVTLTAKYTFGNETVTKEYTVKVPAEEFKIPSTVSTPSISLPTVTEAGKTITWTSSDSSIINVETGVVNIPVNSSAKVTVTGTIAGSDRVITQEITVMPLPATVVYSENYDSLESLDASNANNLWYSTNAAGNVTLQTDLNGGKYVQFAPGNANSRGAISTFPAEGKVTGIYVLDFDLALTAGNGQTTEFAVATENMAYTGNVINNGIASGYLFKLSATNSTVWAVNDGSTFEAAKGEWIHVNAIADTETGTVALKITNSDGIVIYSDTVEMNGAGALRGFYIRGGRYNSVTCVDNVTISQ